MKKLIKEIKWPLVVFGAVALTYFLFRSLYSGFEKVIFESILGIEVGEVGTIFFILRIFCSILAILGIIFIWQGANFYMNKYFGRFLQKHFKE